MNGKGWFSTVMVALGVSLLGYLSWLAGDELAGATRLVVRAGGLVLAGGLSLGLLYLSLKAGINLVSGGLLAVERVKQERQKTLEGAIRQRQAEAEARKLER